MASSQTFHCSVVTPEASVLETEATAASIPAHDGEIGILRDRAPLVCKLGIGELRLDTPDGKRRYFVDGGFAQVARNKVIVLTQQAIPHDRIDAAQAREELNKASHAEGATIADQERRRAALNRARAKIRIADKR